MNHCEVRGNAYICTRFNSNGIVAQLDRASHYGCEGLGFESLQCHKEATKSPTKVGDFWFNAILNQVNKYTMKEMNQLYILTLS